MPNYVIIHSFFPANLISNRQRRKVFQVLLVARRHATDVPSRRRPTTLVSCKYQENDLATPDSLYSCCQAKSFFRLLFDKAMNAIDRESNRENTKSDLERLAFRKLVQIHRTQRCGQVEPPCSAFLPI